MKRHQILILAIVSSLLLMLVGATVLAACAKPAAPEVQVVTVRSMRPFPLDNVMSSTYRRQIEIGNYMGQGQVVFKDMGGAEVYPAFEQIEQCKAGVVDLLNSPGGYFLSVLPEGDFPWLTYGRTGPEFREAGLIDLLDEIAREKLGIAILGAPSYYMFNVFTTFPVNKLEDLAGKKIRTTPSYEPIMKGLGVATVSMPMGELYTSLETGVVEGACLPAMGNVDFGLHEILKYQLYPNFWTVSSHFTFVNAEWLDNLPEFARNVVTESALQLDQEAKDIYQDWEEWDVSRLRAAGVQPVVLSDEEWFRIQEMQWQGGTKRLRELTPDNAEKLIDICKQWYPPKEPIFPTYDWQ